MISKGQANLREGGREGQGEELKKTWKFRSWVLRRRYIARKKKTHLARGRGGKKGTCLQKMFKMAGERGGTRTFEEKANSTGFLTDARKIELIRV